MGKGSTYTLRGFTIIRETEKAILIQRDGDGPEDRMFLPFSQINEIHRGADPTIVMTEWIAREKGLIE